MNMPLFTELVKELVVANSRGDVRAVNQAKGRLLSHFPDLSDSEGLSPSWLEKSSSSNDPAFLGLLVTVGFSLGFNVKHCEKLSSLLYENWHDAHEDIVAALVSIGDSSAIPAIRHVIDWIPSKLEWDDSRALRSKAVHALEKMEQIL